MSALPKPFYTAQQYLELEEKAETKSRNQKRVSLRPDFCHVRRQPAPQ